MFFKAREQTLNFISNDRSPSFRYTAFIHSFKSQNFFLNKQHVLFRRNYYSHYLNLDMTRSSITHSMNLVVNDAIKVNQEIVGSNIIKQHFPKL